VVGLTGSLDESIGRAAEYGAFVRYGSSFGVFVQAGGHFSSHGITNASLSYKLTNWYIEPRFAVQTLSRTVAPFVSGRVGYSIEIAEGGNATLRASGFTLGSGGGVLVRLGPQISMEGGAALSTIAFGDYAFQGEFVWKECLDGLSEGSPLPQSVVGCTGAPGGPVILCYPPFFPFEVSGDCVPPEIPYADSARSATLLRIWLGIHFSFSKQ
jgi:hypothetical protein